MLYLIAALITTTVVLVGFAVAQALPARSAAVSRRMAEIQRLGRSAVRAEQQQRKKRRARVEEVLRQVGNRFHGGKGNEVAVKNLLVQAGFRGASAPAMLWGARLVLVVGLSMAALAFLTASGARVNQVLLYTGAAAAAGWIGPTFFVSRKRKRRMKEIQLALPDALDLMVVCVEAGLGLNQAMARVSDEIRHVSEVMSEEFALINLEIRAGVERMEALRNLAQRTGVEDVRTLVAILVQTDRFGTSVATALRTQSDTMRTKRRQRAEEAAAKTTIKLILPLVFCVFPAIFTVILGPAVIQIFRVFLEM